MHDIPLQRHLSGNHQVPEVLQILRLAFHLLMHVPAHSDGMEKYVYVLPDAESHTYRNYMFPEKQLHNLLRIHADTHTHQSSSDILRDQ